MYLARKTHTCAAVLGACISTTAVAQWSQYRYDITRAGLFDGPHTGGDGLQISTVSSYQRTGWLAGYANRYAGVNANNGRDSWLYDHHTRTTVQIGLQGGVHRGTSGYQYSTNQQHTRSGFVAGVSDMVRGEFSTFGFHTWVADPRDRQTYQVGLIGGVFTLPSGAEISELSLLNDAGQAAGRSERFDATPTGTQSFSAWAYNPTTHATVDIGLNTPAHVSITTFRRNSSVRYMTASGLVYGASTRYGIDGVLSGGDAWIYRPASGATTPIGLIDEQHIGLDERRNNFCTDFRPSGEVIGTSTQYVDGLERGTDMWFYDPATNTSRQMGLIDAAHTSNDGFRESGSTFFNDDAPYVPGSSARFAGPDYRGRDTWLYNIATGATVPVGLAGGIYMSSTGFQDRTIRSQDPTGRVTGYAHTYDGANSNGWHGWTYDPATNTTTRIGLADAAHTGDTGQHTTLPLLQSDGGVVAGISRRFSGSTSLGWNTWVYQPALQTSIQIGLTAPANTGTGGFQNTQVDFINDAGAITGYSFRIIGATEERGQNTWVFDPATQSTIQTGLIDEAHTRASDGFQGSTNVLLSESGDVGGWSYRNANNGRDAWYYDSDAQLTSQPTLGIVGGIRSSDNYAFSMPSVLTEDGFMLGYYSFFEGGAGNGQDRAFIFRPDLGFTDLGSLVDGGLSASGWSTLLRPEYSTFVDYMVGTGIVSSNNPASRSVFVLTTVPAPAAAWCFVALFACNGRSRRARVSC